MIYILASLVLAFGCLILYKDYHKTWPEDQKGKKQ